MTTMSIDEKLDEALKETFPASDAFTLCPDVKSSPDVKHEPTIAQPPVSAEAKRVHK